MLDFVATFYYQGAPGAFSHKAAQMLAEQEFPGIFVNFQDCSRFDQVFQYAVDTKHGIAVLPVENSTIGPIVQNYDLLRAHESLHINRDLYLPVKHSLLAKIGVDLREIRNVYSHPAALQQCRNLFEDHPRMVPVEAFDTAGAAEFVSQREDPTIAAIAHEEAAVLYNLAVLKRDVQDFQGNSTRFVLMSKGRGASCLPAKITVQFEVNAARLLALSEVMPLQNKIQITSVVSRPIPDAPWTYALFVDFLCQDFEDIETVEALHYTRLIGCYPSQQPIPFGINGARSAV